MLTAANVCTTSSGRLFITDKQQYLVDTGSDLCFFPRKLLPGRLERTGYTLYAANGTNTSTRPLTTCGTSHSTGLSPKGVTTIYHASPDNRLHRRTHSSAASPDPCATPDNQLPRTDSLACSSTGPLCAAPLTDYPGTQTPVAGRQRHIAPDHLAAVARTQHDSSSPPAQPCTAPTKPEPPSRPLKTTRSGRTVRFPAQISYCFPARFPN
jgi:hypothetical protein